MFSMYVMVVVVVLVACLHGLESVLIQFRGNSKAKNPLDAWKQGERSVTRPV
jgi:hypothetical protein